MYIEVIHLTGAADYPLLWPCKSQVGCSQFQADVLTYDHETRGHPKTETLDKVGFVRVSTCWM